MSANNIIVIIKELDGKFRGYHRDYDAWTEGQYDDGGPCPCLEIAGMLNFTRKGIPIADCQICHGSGQVCAPKETQVFEADTIEGAIHAYDEWLERMNGDGDEFPFVVEYGYQFVGLEPVKITEKNAGLAFIHSVGRQLDKTIIEIQDEEKKVLNQETIETLEKSERGEDLYKVDSVEELMEDLESDDGKLKGHSGDCTIYATLDNTGMPEAGICTCGFGLRRMRETGDINAMYSKELGESLLKRNKDNFVSLKQENEKLKNRLAIIDEAIRKMFDEDDSYVIETLREMIAKNLGEKFEPWM